MSPELEYKLFHKYPTIFRQRKLPMTQSAMCFGFECQNGWYNILDNLCQHIQDYVNENNCGPVEAVQIKEKFGGLRFYITGGDDAIDMFIQMAEEESYHTCEYCGTKENVGMTRGWNVTCCADCHKKFRSELTWSKNE